MPPIKPKEGNMDSDILELVQTIILSVIAFFAKKNSKKDA